MEPSQRSTRTWLLPLAAVLWNQSIYYGGGLAARGLHHYDWTLEIDRLTPFLPWTVSIYFLCYLFWAAGYIVCARQERARAYRFFCGDMLGKAVCLIFFLLVPTTNVRPVVDGTGFWDMVMRFLYQVDAPVNLFPSIHCLVSWMCWIGVRGQKDIPFWYRTFSLWMATAVCVSTLTTKQHVFADVAGGIALAELGYWAAGLEPVSRVYSRWADRAVERAIRSPLVQKAARAIRREGTETENMRKGS